jgi:hypothetical protein
MATGFPKSLPIWWANGFFNQINPPTFEKGHDTFLCHEIIPVAFTTLVQQAILDQTMIGWNHSIQGFLAKKWMEVASTSYNWRLVRENNAPSGWTNSDAPGYHGIISPHDGDMGCQKLGTTRI